MLKLSMYLQNKENPVKNVIQGVPPFAFSSITENDWKVLWTHNHVYIWVVSDFCCEGERQCNCINEILA